MKTILLLAAICTMTLFFAYAEEPSSKEEVPLIIQAITSAESTPTPPAPEKKIPEQSDSLAQPEPLKATVNGSAPLSSNMGYMCIPGENLKIRLDVSQSPSSMSEVSLLPIATPGEKHSYEITSSRSLRCEHTGGILLKVLENGIEWQAPSASGTTQIKLIYHEKRQFTNLEKPEKVQDIGSLEDEFILNALVQFPFQEESGAVENYALGLYPDQDSSRVPSIVASHKDTYAPPKYFVKVTPSTEGLYLSERYRLGDFSPRSGKGKNHFIVLDQKLVEMLENINDALVAKGHKVRSLKILRAYISPMERTRLARQGIKLSTFTRFQYGDAVGVIVDENDDGIIDDLNADGKIDYNDADVLHEIIEEVMIKTHNRGGHGVFSNFKDPDHPDTPYVQFDLRGFSSPFRYVTIKAEE